MNWLYYVQKCLAYIVNKLSSYNKIYTHLLDITGIRAYIHKGHYINYKYQGDFMNLPVDFGDNSELVEKTNVMRCFQMCRWMCYAHIMETSKTFHKYISRDELFRIPHDRLHLHDIECCKFNNIYYSISHTLQVHSDTHETKKTAYIVFSGTQFFDIEAWAMNLQFKLQSINDDPKLLFHSGYVAKMFSVHGNETNLYDKLEKECSGYDDIYVSGHSMGAAFALLFSYLYKTHHCNVNVHAILCALPRVCNRHFVKQIKKLKIQATVYIHPYDCVRLLPFDNFNNKNKKEKYAYPGTVIDVTSNIELNTEKQLAFFDFVHIFIFGVYYHTVDRYLKNFKKWYKIKNKSGKSKKHD